MKKIFIFLLLALSLKADIVFNGVCGSYEYNLSVRTSKYYGGYCKDNTLVAYYDGSTDYIRGIYTDPQVSNSLDTYSISTGRVRHSYEYDEGSVKFIGSPQKSFLDGLSGILVAFGIFQIIMMIGG